MNCINGCLFASNKLKQREWFLEAAMRILLMTTWRYKSNKVCSTSKWKQACFYVVTYCSSLTDVGSSNFTQRKDISSCNYSHGAESFLRTSYTACQTPYTTLNRINIAQTIIPVSLRSTMILSHITHKCHNIPSRFSCLYAVPISHSSRACYMPRTRNALY
jgi:hypothetical protein